VIPAVICFILASLPLLGCVTDGVQVQELVIESVVIASQCSRPTLKVILLYVGFLSVCLFVHPFCYILVLC